MLDTACKTNVTRQEGLEPPTNSLEGCRSIHLSYWRLLCRWPPTRGPPRSTTDPPHLTCPTARSGRPDSNRRPPAPKAGAIPGYATPRRSAAAYVIPRVRRGQRGLENPLPLSEHTTPVAHWLARRALTRAKHLRALNAPPDVRSRRERPHPATAPRRHDHDD